MLYVGLVDGADGAWGCRLPDFPGCNGGGATIEEAVADATSALREYAADMVRDGEELPKPRSVEVILADTLSNGQIAGVPVFVPLILDSGRPVRANISLDSGLLEAIDEAAERAGVTRSGWLASCARERLLSVPKSHRADLAELVNHLASYTSLHRAMAQHAEPEIKTLEQLFRERQAVRERR